MKKIVFCDFDGTITVEETFVAMLKRFAPEISARLLPEIFSKRLTLRQGVREMVESIASSNYDEIIEFGRSHPIRAGFLDLIDFLEAESIPLVIISGGLRGTIEAVVEPFRDRIADIYAMDVNTADSHLRIYSRYEGGTELVAKAQIMATYDADVTISIGDSITDINLALASSIAFARPPLTSYLEAENHPYLPWNDFFEVRDRLAAWLEAEETMHLASII